MDDGDVFTGVDRDRTLNSLESFVDLVSALVLGRVVESLAIPNDHDTPLMAQVSNRLLHLLEILVVWHLICHKNKKDVGGWFLRLGETAHVEQSLEIANEGDNPLDRRHEFKLLKFDFLFGQEHT